MRITSIGYFSVIFFFSHIIFFSPNYLLKPPLENRAYNFLTIGDSVPTYYSSQLEDLVVNRYGWNYTSLASPACPIAMRYTIQENIQKMESGHQECYKIYGKRLQVVRDKKIDIVLFHTRFDLYFEYGMYDFQAETQPHIGTEEWFNTVTRNILEDFDKLLAINPKMLFVIIPIEIPSENIARLTIPQLLGVLKLEKYISRLNQFFMGLASERIVTISLIDLVCGDLENPCPDKLQAFGGRYDGVHYAGSSLRIVPQMIFEQIYSTFRFSGEIKRRQELSNTGAHSF